VKSKENSLNKKGAKYDGRSRPSSELYRQRWYEIFGKKKKDKETNKQR
jgi:hypothetical protein